MSQWLSILGWGTEELDDLRHVGYSYIKQGIYDIALTFFDALAILSPPNAYDLQTLGALHLQLGNSLKALDYLDRALKLAPEHLPTRLNRVKALFALGQKYRRQGLQEASELQLCSDESIAAQARALVLVPENQ